MHSYNLFLEWLVQGPYLLFAAIIGIIVSIDVFVVEATRDYPEKEANARGVPIQSQRAAMAFTHALMHSTAFFVYTGAIYLLQYVTFISLDIFDIPDGFYSSILVLFNFLIISFVWWTYRGKISEDHSDKDHDAAEPARYDMRLAVDVLRATFRKLKIPSLPGLTIAGTVAVDMLAVSALLKTWLLPVGYQAAVAQLTGTVLVDLALFALVIFAVVVVVVFLAHAVNNSLRHRPSAFAVLRVAEPMAIFFVMAGMLRSLDVFVPVVSDDLVSGWLLVMVDLGFATAMTVSLLVANGIGWNGLVELSKKRSTHGAGPAPKDFKTIWVELRQHLYGLPWAFGVLVATLVSFLIALNTGDEHNHIVEATGYFSAIVAVATLAALYTPSVRMDQLERSRTDNAFAGIQSQPPKEFGLTFCGTAMALSFLCIHMAIVLGTDVRAFEATLLWAAYIVIAWGLFDLRRWRFWKADMREAAHRNSTTPSRISAADAGEYASTIGLSSGVVTAVALFATRFPF